MTIPTNITPAERKRLRSRARKMRQLRGLGWSQREVAEALDCSRALVRKTLKQVDAAKHDSLYWELGVVG